MKRPVKPWMAKIRKAFGPLPAVPESWPHCHRAGKFLDVSSAPSRGAWQICRRGCPSIADCKLARDTCPSLPVGDRHCSPQDISAPQSIADQEPRDIECPSPLPFSNDWTQGETLSPGERHAYTPDKGDVVENIIRGCESLHAQVSGWHLTVLRESHIIGAERSLVALQALLIQLRGHVPASAAE